MRGYTIPVYESDGVTQIGVFQVGGPGSGSGGESADGTEWERHSDEAGNIITTTTHPDGTVTIETEALDGTVTTKTLTAAEVAASRQPHLPSPKAPSKPEPDKPQAWLLEHMTQVARDAGDARATAQLGTAVEKACGGRRGRRCAVIGVCAGDPSLDRHPARRLQKRRLDVPSAGP